MLASWGYEVKIAEDGEKALDLRRSFQPHILLSDLRMPHRDGLNLLRDIRELHLETLPIIISGVGEIPDAVQAIKLGASDYLSKPIDPPHLQQILKKLTEHIDVREENLRLRRRLVEVGELGPLFGKSLAMRRVLTSIERLAESSASVIITGESGTGKELAARAIHRNSARRDQPFVAINCAALTETLLESELFGHERGSFTGAVCQKRGQLEMANTGTIFLDEMGEISPGMQAKLLRVLQEREFTRVGGTRSMPLNIRVIAATNKNLQKATKDGTFREDLYYRLNVVSITMPSLRDHKEDIPLLAGYFAAKYAERCNRRILGISPDAGALLSQYDWPGNIRELENAVERAVVLGSSGMILPEDLPETLHETPAQSMRSSTYHEAVRQLKRQLILTAMDQSDGKITEAARLLGVHSNYLHRLIRNLDLRLTLKKRNKA